jgi:hypothetical protein
VKGDESKCVWEKTFLKIRDRYNWGKDMENIFLKFELPTK